MASLSITATDVAEVKFTSMSMLGAPSAVALTNGQCVRFDTSTGKWVLAAGDNATNAGNLRYIVVGSNRINLYTAIRDAIVDLGKSVLDAGDWGDPVYLSDTAGELTLVGAESTTTTVVGYIVPLMSGDTINKALQIV